MFRRRWSGLPEDPDFPIDLEKLGQVFQKPPGPSQKHSLGNTSYDVVSPCNYQTNLLTASAPHSYFIQPETDEIRSIANPNFYFNYFRTKNERHNDRQRFAFNLAVQEVIHARLEALGLAKVPLPPPAPAATATKRSSSSSDSTGDQPRRQVPIFVSKDLCEADRVVVLFGEGLQQLGVLAHRVIGGQGGVDKGSVVSLVKALLGGHNSNNHNKGETEATEKDTQTTKTGVILANTGERWWWPQGQRALTYRDSMGVKMKSCVHKTGSFDPAVNSIAGSEDVAVHVRSVFERVLANDVDHDKEEQQVSFVAPGARIQIIAVGEAAAAVETYLDQNWGRWKGRVNCLAMLGDGKPVYDLEDEGFKKFLREVSGVPVSDVDKDDPPSAVLPFFSLSSSKSRTKPN